jgi:hypothetical protein
VDFAEDADDAGAIEAHRLRTAGRIATKIERARSPQREHVVIGVVAVREVDGRADGNRKHVRHERLVALIHRRALRLDVGECE